MAQRLAAAFGLCLLVAVVVVVAQGMSTTAKDVAGILIVAGLFSPFVLFAAGAYRTMTRDTRRPLTRRERYPEPWERQQPARSVIDVSWYEVGEEIEGASRELQI